MTELIYSQLQKFFLYLVATINLHPRYVFGWKLSNSLYTELCLEVLEMVLSNGRRPEIFFADQRLPAHFC